MSLCGTFRVTIINSGVCLETFLVSTRDETKDRCSRHETETKTGDMLSQNCLEAKTCLETSHRWNYEHTPRLQSYMSTECCCAPFPVTTVAFSRDVIVNETLRHDRETRTRLLLLSPPPQQLQQQHYNNNYYYYYYYHYHYHYYYY